MASPGGCTLDPAIAAKAELIRQKIERLHSLYSDEQFDFDEIINPHMKLSKVRADQIRSIERLSKPSVPATIGDYDHALCESG